MEVIDKENIIYLTPKHVASVLNVSIYTLKHWRQHNQGPPAVKVGGRWKYRIEDLNAWVAGNHK